MLWARIRTLQTSRIAPGRLAKSGALLGRPVSSVGSAQSTPPQHARFHLVLNVNEETRQRNLTVLKGRAIEAHATSGDSNPATSTQRFRSTICYLIISFSSTSGMVLIIRPLRWVLFEFDHVSNLSSKSPYLSKKFDCFGEPVAPFLCSPPTFPTLPLRASAASLLIGMLAITAHPAVYISNVLRNS